MRRDVFIVSKPLRFLNIKNVVPNCGDSHKTLIVVDSFADAYNFKMNVEKFDTSWNKVYLVKSVKYLYFLLLFLHIDRLYTFVDCSIFVGILYLLKRVKVCVLEEGAGSYIPNSIGGVQKNIHKLLGIGKNIGCSKFTWALYVYSPYAYKKLNPESIANVIPFPHDFVSNMRQYTDLFLKISSTDINNIEDVKNGNILIYITNWDIDQSILSKIDELKVNYDKVIIKPHPHITDYTLIPKGYHIIGGNILAELFISLLLNNNNNLTVIHSSSTALLYFQNKVKQIILPVTKSSVHLPSNYMKDYERLCDYVNEKYSNNEHIMNTAFIVQARMGSTRLPKKVLRPFYGDKCILQLLVEKLAQVEGVKTIIATSVGNENDIIEEFCDQNNVTCFRGDENDVIKRFIDAAEANGVERIIRICSDNPFLEFNSIKALVAKASNSDADYISFNINGSPSIKTHFGFWTEYTTLAALKKARAITDEKFYHEHVTNFIYANPDMFKVEWIEGPACLNGRDNIRLTIDTPEDFENAQRVYNELCMNNPCPTIDEVVECLDAHSDIYYTMSQQINQNSK